MPFLNQIPEISLYYKYNTQFEKSWDYHDYINECEGVSKLFGTHNLLKFTI